MAIRDRFPTMGEEIGMRIKERRDRLGLTQQELGDKIHRSREYVSKWESGERGLKVEDLVLIADVLETSCDYLLKGYEPEYFDFCNRTGLSNRALENLLKICDESPDTLDSVGFVESFINDLLESSSIKAIATDYRKMKWCAERLCEMKLKGVADTERKLYRDSQARRIRAYNQGTPSDLPLPSNELVIEAQEDELDYRIYSLLDTIKRAIKED